ncbi:MAG: 3-oxoacyl-[acyl-carrier-protein] reductase [Desulfobacterota bacterium]|nr:3-oxoacyl-[acyl-carrier-protein] reductase [Thermodesulfobacteriota bacterium]
MNLENNIALVTGAGQGIGKTIALTLAQYGADVVIADINEATVSTVAHEVEAFGRRALPFVLDVVNLAACEEAIKKTIDTFGKLDILVNNAGITRDMVLLRMKEEQWDQVIAVNLKGTFNCTKAAIRYMFRNKYGRIINIASVTGAMGNPGQANYAASKAAIMGFTKAVAREYAHCGITVNAVAPGFIKTAMTDAIPDKEREAMIAMIPAQKLGMPEDVAHLVCFLASDLAAYITGQVIHVNGGLYM